MSVRIYQLSKEIGMENNELLDLLRERGFQVKSASSTVDNISAESLKEEFASKVPEAVIAQPEEIAAPAEPVAPPSASAFVRTKEQIVEEREEAKESAKKQPNLLLLLCQLRVLPRRLQLRRPGQ
jgi:translation initiation factor IF-2